MISAFAHFPILLQSLFVSAVAMMAPAALASAQQDWHSARAYFYAGLLTGFLALMLALADAQRVRSQDGRVHLLSLLLGFVLLPFVLAVPLWESISNTVYLNTWFEMVSSLTTTGATVFDDPGRLTDADHFWRAIVGWLGGFLVLVAAIAILAPLSLGGFEVLGPPQNETAASFSQIAKTVDTSTRIRRHAGQVAPVYTVLTAFLWLALIISGTPSLDAICIAMSTLSTSGITAGGDASLNSVGFAGEVFVFLFLLLALSRNILSQDRIDSGARPFSEDPELRMGLSLVLLVPLLLFFRHWVGAAEVDTANALGDGFQALWGGAFMVLSFLSTAGFESSAWGEARDWSGLETPGLILLGLAMIGGGVATTAGGVKLLRVFVLYKTTQRELERLVHPNSVGGSGGNARYQRRQGAYVAWISFMLFAVSIAGIMLTLALSGQDFDSSLIFSISALSTTGPLVNVVGEADLAFGSLSEFGKVVLGLSMILGRLETLAIIALLNPEFWRN